MLTNDQLQEVDYLEGLRAWGTSTLPCQVVSVPLKVISAGRRQTLNYVRCLDTRMCGPGDGDSELRIGRRRGAAAHVDGKLESMVRKTDDKLRSARTLPLFPPGKARTYGTNKRLMPSNTQLTKVCGATLSWRRSMTRMRFSLCFSSRHSPCLPRETMPM